MGLPIQWLSHLRDQEAKREFEKVVRNSTQVLGRFQELILQYEKSLTSMDEDFTVPNWPEKHAFILGQRRACRDFLQLLAFMNDG